MIREAISHSPDYRVKNAHVFAKGSVRMRTNIRSTSDIDVCVKADDVFFADYPTGASNSTYKNSDSEYTFAEFRKAVEDAICGYFGYTDVDVEGNKAIRINAGVGTSRIDADVVPAFEHRRYTSLEHDNYHEGIELRPKNSIYTRVINWPDQNYDNGLHKQENTYRRYRKMVRILKRMKGAMKDKGIASTDHALSFLIESLLWNVPHDFYGNDNYADDLASIFEHLKYQLATDERIKEWGEVNELKYLFGSHQRWTRVGAEAFINDADRYFGAMS
jgi:hypothetical protein